MHLITPYLIQYLQTNQTESVSIDQLQIEIDVPPPNLLLLPIQYMIQFLIH